MGLALGLVAVLVVLVSPTAPAAPASPPNPVAVTMSRSTMQDRVGDRFAFTTQVRNHSARPLEGLVAHLNIVSMASDVYVDPEDWSSQRTRYLPTLPAHGTIDLPWTVQAVNDGRFVLYVAVTTRHGSDRVVSSGTLRLTTTARHTLGAGGVLPVALGVPGLLVLLMLGVGARRRRLR
jgi:hypothetical protein